MQEELLIAPDSSTYFFSDAGSSSSDSEYEYDALIKGKKSRFNLWHRFAKKQRHSSVRLWRWIHKTDARAAIIWALLMGLPIALVFAIVFAIPAAFVPDICKQTVQWSWIPGCSESNSKKLPKVTSLLPSNVTAISATLRGSVDTKQGSVEGFFFYYGLESAPRKIKTYVHPINGSGEDVVFSTNVSDLLPGKTYVVTATIQTEKATNIASTPIRFTTLVPTINVSASNMSFFSAVLNARIDSNSLPNLEYRFYYGPPTNPTKFNTSFIAINTTGNGIERNNTVHNLIPISDFNLSAVLQDNKTKHQYNSTINITMRTLVPPYGTLIPKSGSLGCVGPMHSCEHARGVTSGGNITGLTIAMSSNGENLYSGGSGIGIFSRNATGALSMLSGKAGCVIGATNNKDCAIARGIGSISYIAVTADGKNLYVGGTNGYKEAFIGIFNCNKNGELTQLSGEAGCIGNVTQGCSMARCLGSGITAITVTSDGKFVYIASFDGKISAFTRSSDNGALIQLTGAAGCIHLNMAPKTMVVSRDVRYVYVAGFTPFKSIYVYARDIQSGELVQLTGTAGCLTSGLYPPPNCTLIRGLTVTNSTTIIHQMNLALTNDDSFMYMVTEQGSASSFIGIFMRNQTSGALTQLPDPKGCLVGKSYANNSHCITKDNLNLYPLALVVSSDMRTVYVGGVNSETLPYIGVFTRDSRTGTLTKLPKGAGCLSGSSSKCAYIRTFSNFSFIWSLIESTDGQNLYAGIYIADSNKTGLINVFSRYTNRTTNNTL